MIHRRAYMLDKFIALQLTGSGFRCNLYHEILDVSSEIFIVFGTQYLMQMPRLHFILG